MTFMTRPIVPTRIKCMYVYHGEKIWSGQFSWQWGCIPEFQWVCHWSCSAECWQSMFISCQVLTIMVLICHCHCMWHYHLFQTSQAFGWHFKFRLQCCNMVLAWRSYIVGSNSEWNQKLMSNSLIISDDWTSWTIWSILTKEMNCSIFLGQALWTIISQSIEI